MRVLYCRDFDSMESALERLQHHGIISMDARWAPQKRLLPGSPPEWFGQQVSVITLSTQSEIVVCHLALNTRYKHDSNVPSTLKLLLEDPSIVKVGVDLVKLQLRLARYLDIHLRGICDVGSLSISLQSISTAERRHSPDDDIKRLAKQCFGWELAASSRQGNFWLNPLSLPDLLGKISDLIGKTDAYKYQALSRKLMHAYVYSFTCFKACWTPNLSDRYPFRDAATTQSGI